MAQLKDNQLIFHDEEGNEIVCDIIFTYDSEATGKKYVIFQAEGDESGEVGAASYVEKGNGEGELEPIETEEEWELLQDALNDFLDQEEEN
jgi:uncharacterized protein YrzB (UPF0473 family)